jgi:Trk K+ transport system NAD-binding subunit
VQAVQRERKLIRFPTAETAILPGDRLMVCGKDEDIERLRGLLVVDLSQTAD